MGMMWEEQKLNNKNWQEIFCLEIKLEESE